MKTGFGPKNVRVRVPRGIRTTCLDRPHFAQHLAEAGAPESWIQHSMRNRSATITTRYTRMVDNGENARVVGSVLVPPAHLQVGRAETLDLDSLS